jgi:hypothetical protein
MIAGFLMMGLAAPAWAGSLGGRELSSHIIIGVDAGSAFDVTVEGEALPESPITSSSDGIVTFQIDDAGLPPGSHTVFVSATGDLIIGGVYADGITTNTAIIHWSTNLPADSSVEYGPTDSYGMTTPADPELTTDHAVTLTELSAGVTYHFRVLSDAGGGQSAASGDHEFATTSDPLVVSGVTIDAVSATWVTITWQTNRAADSQIAYGETIPYSFETGIDPSMVTDHSVTITGLDPDTWYHFSVRSEDEFGEVVYSEDHVFETALAPLAVTDVIATVTGTSADVTWVTNQLADSQVEYGLDASYGAVSPLDPAMVLGHSITVAGLEPGATYHYRVRSEDEFGEIVFSDDHTFDAGFDPLEMSGLVVTGVGINWAIIEWTTDRPADACVHFGLTSDYGDSVKAEGFVEAHACTLTGLAEATVYHFRAVSLDEHGVLAASADSLFETMEGVPMMPPEMSGLTLRATSVMSVVVSWTTDVPATSEVMYGADGGLTETTGTDSTLVLEHEVHVFPLIPNVEFTFCAVSGSPGGTCSSDPCTFCAGPPTGMQSNDKPAVVIRPGVWAAVETEVRIRWSTDRPCSTWVGYGADSSYGSIGMASGLSTCSYEVVLSALEPASEYHYCVYAWDECGGVAVGEDLTFRTATPPDLEPPAAPGGVCCRAWAGIIEVTWLPNSEEDLAGYFIYRIRYDPATGDDFGRTEKLNEDPLMETVFYDSHVEPANSYAYYTTAVDTAGNESDASDGASITLAPEPPASILFTRYPNPTFGSATLSFDIPGPEPSDVILRILSIDGRVVRELAHASYDPGSYSIVWEGEDRRGDFASSGIYLCELTVNDRILRHKLTLIR